MSNNKTKKSWNVSKATRDAVVGAAERVQILKERTTNLAQRAGEKWEESKPHRQKVEDELKKATEKIVDFGKEVQKGFKAGVAEVQNSNRKKRIRVTK